MALFIYCTSSGDEIHRSEHKTLGEACAFYFDNHFDGADQESYVDFAEEKVAQAETKRWLKILKEHGDG